MYYNLLTGLFLLAGILMCGLACFILNKLHWLLIASICLCSSLSCVAVSWHVYCTKQNNNKE